MRLPQVARTQGAGATRLTDSFGVNRGSDQARGIPCRPGEIEGPSHLVRDDEHEKERLPYRESGSDRQVEAQRLADVLARENSLDRMAGRSEARARSGRRDPD